MKSAYLYTSDQLCDEQTWEEGEVEEGTKYFDGYNWSDYKYGYNGNTKYNSTDGKRTLDSSDDAVTVAWGGNWRTPTNTEYETLINSTTSQFVEGYNGSNVDGMLFTDKNDSSKTLFFPAAGYCMNGQVEDFPWKCYYWTNTIIGDHSSARVFNIYNSGDNVELISYWRMYGMTVRGVLDE